MLKVFTFLAVLLVAVPFAYMVGDVLVDVFRRFYDFFRSRAKPFITNLLTSLF